MPRVSAGLLLYRRRDGTLEVFLAHPGGPYWARKDDGAWVIPKGEVDEGEDLLAAALREFREETGFDVAGPFQPLHPVRQRGGKMVHVWTAEADVDPAAVSSNTFTLEWPPRSGRMRSFPEIDRAEWMVIDVARMKILVSQRPLIDALVELLAPAASPGPPS
jgi:predicted NUDIX family NTP pyrophosphohydrolase